MKPILEVSPQASAKYLQNGFDVSYYIVNKLPLPMSERFFPITIQSTQQVKKMNNNCTREQVLQQITAALLEKDVRKAKEVIKEVREVEKMTGRQILASLTLRDLHLAILEAELEQSQKLLDIYE